MQLTIENRFLQHFSINELDQLYRAYIPQPEQACINLYEPIAINLAGRWLLSQQQSPLLLSYNDTNLILNKLRPLSTTELHTLLTSLCHDIAINFPFANSTESIYFFKVLEFTCPRLTIALSGGNLSHFFLTDKTHT